MNLNIVIGGVGGQGTLLASRILGALAIELGQDVKASEVHGMAQRGGSVITFLRMGNSIFVPVVETACADYVLAFEMLEAARALPYLKKGGTLITNTQEISPMPVIIGKAPYPGDILEKLNVKCNVMAFDALQMAREAGEARAVNLVLLGALARFTGFDIGAWHSAIEKSVPLKLRAVNMDAFDRGYRYINQ